MDYCYAGEVVQAPFYGDCVRCLIVAPRYVVLVFKVVQYGLNKELVPDEGVPIDDLHFLVFNLKIIPIIVLDIKLRWCALVK